MKRIKVEIQVTFLTVIIAAAMIGSGYLVYSSLSEIVDSIHKESRPDSRLLLLKDIASDLTGVENSVRMYSLTGDPAFMTDYRQLSASVQQQLTELKNYEIPGSGETQLIDSIRQLTNEKLTLLEKIRALHNKKPDTKRSFTELYSKIDTAIVPFDTIRVKKEEEKEKKEGFFKRLLTRKEEKKESTPPPAIIIDKSEEKENIKQEIANFERQITDQNRKLQVQEKNLQEQNIEITSLLLKQISILEYKERRRLETKMQEADFMAAQTYRRLTLFTIAAVVLLMTVLLIFFRNIQRNRSYQQVMRKAKAEAENLAKAKEMFVATVSHEMRTPINAIYGLTEQLLQRTTEIDMVTDLEVVHKSAEHLITLVNDTLDFSKIEAQKLKIEQLDFLPEEVFKEVYILNKSTALTKGIELLVRNNGNPELTLKGDPIRLKQILINLVSNAIKFTTAGMVTLETDYQEEGNLIWLISEITDTGIGISREDTEKIFDEFVQLDNDLTQKHRGAGLGLSIVKKLVNLQGGTISVTSTPGKGTRFTIRIPYQKGNAYSIIKQAGKKLEIPAHLKELRFLLVDDEEFNLHLLKNILRKWGVSYTEATNGKMALELESRGKFDLIFMDVRMPVMDGFESSRQILKLRPGTKIIALTAANNQEDIKKSKEAGMLGLLQKPFTEAELLALVTGFFPENQETPVKPHVPVNPHELEKMSGSDKTFFKEMIKIFIKSSENAVQTMKRSMVTQDWNAIGEAAHKLAAPAKHMAALYLYDKLKILEKEAPDTKNPSEIEKIVAEIDTEVRQIHTLLKQKLES
jgi:signal transduction histidine kinase/DNA-binding response OmpR family regulator